MAAGGLGGFVQWICGILAGSSGTPYVDSIEENPDGDDYDEYGTGNGSPERERG